jgi:chromatin remodeling complex protein RSC6
MRRTDVTREINVYIRVNNLNDPNNKCKINPDTKLQTLFQLNSNDELTYFNIHDNGIIIYIGMATLITLALAIASWHWVEKPCLSLKYRNFINSK